MSFLDEALTRAVEAKIRTTAQHTNRVSQAGITCARRLQWHRTKWQSASPIDVGLARRFELGNIFEPAIIRRLQDAGLTITETQRDLSWVQLQLTGHVDAIVKTPEGDEAVFELKSVASFTFTRLRKKIHTPADLLAEGGYLAGYVAQTAVYVLLKGLRRGYLLFVNKDTFESFTLEVVITDNVVLEAAEAFLKRIEAVNKAIADGVDLPPEPGDYCERCPFLATCLPDQLWSAPTLVEDEEVEGWLEQREALKPLGAELEEVDDALKARFKDPGETIVGSWLVRVKEIEKSAFTVPARKEIRRAYNRIEKQAVVTAAKKEEPDAPREEARNPEVAVDQHPRVAGAQEEGGG